MSLFLFFSCEPICRSVVTLQDFFFFAWYVLVRNIIKAMWSMSSDVLQYGRGWNQWLKFMQSYFALFDLHDSLRSFSWTLNVYYVIIQIMNSCSDELGIFPLKCMKMCILMHQLLFYSWKYHIAYFFFVRIRQATASQVMGQ